MAIQKTNLYLRLRALDPWFRGTPQQFAEAIVAAMEIVAPFGITTFVSGGAMPSSNQGPWLKDGTEWWVWSDEQGTYVPQSLESSFPQLYYIQTEEPPTNAGIYIWFKIEECGCPHGLYLLINGKWVHFAGDPESGPTADRPTAPHNFEEYYDTDIECLIWYERSEWRTKSGVKGDLKYVDAQTREEALTQNPGWEIFGTGESSNINWRGKAPYPAAKDNDGMNPLEVPTGVTARSTYELFGVESQNLTNAQLAGAMTHIHGYGWRLTGGGDIIHFTRYADYEMPEADYGTPTYAGYMLDVDSVTATSVESKLNMFTTQPTQHPDNADAAAQQPVQMAGPSIALFLMRKR